jgi:polyamine oxidase
LIRLEEKLTSVELMEDEECDNGSVVLTTRTSSEKQSSSQERRYEAPYTLLTLPLGVLEHSPPDFTPPMSIRRKQKQLAGLEWDF